MTEKNDQLKRLLQSVARTEEVEIGCDEVYAVLDQYADAKASGEDVSAIMPLVKLHLDMCPDCFEECEALLEVIEAEIS
jgi:uncharacterized protein (UPF0335 family)